jgi:hypothetical protein
MAYKNIPSVDENFQFPPEIRQAFAESIQFRTALILSLTGPDTPLAEILDSLALEPTSALVGKLQELSLEYSGNTGAAGERGEAGSGVVPVLLGEKIMTTSSAAVGSSLTNWANFNLTVTKGAKPYVVKLDMHLQPGASAAPATLVVALFEDGNQIQQWNTPAAYPSIAYHFHGETVTLNPAPGTHTYQVKIRTNHSSGTMTGVATDLATGYPAYMKVVEQ